MSDHLPECIYAPRNVDPDRGIEWGGSPCICDALRACEARVREEWYEVQSETWEQGYEYGITAATHIVRDQPHMRHDYWVYIRRNETVAAIDALRGER